MKSNPKLIYLCQSLYVNKSTNKAKSNLATWTLIGIQRKTKIKSCGKKPPIVLELPFTANMEISVEEDAVVVQLVIATLMDSPWALLASRFQANRIPLPIPFSGNPYLWHRFSTLVPAQARGMSSGHAKDGVADTRQLVESKQGEGS
jgi:hypothetical protein